MLTIASTIHATRTGRSPPTDRARREPASRRSGTGAVSGARFSRIAIARVADSRDGPGGRLAYARLLERRGRAATCSWREAGRLRARGGIGVFPQMRANQGGGASVMLPAETRAGVIGVKTCVLHRQPRRA